MPTWQADVTQHGRWWASGSGNWGDATNFNNPRMDNSYVAGWRFPLMVPAGVTILSAQIVAARHQFTSSTPLVEVGAIPSDDVPAFQNGQHSQATVGKTQTQIAAGSTAVIDVTGAVQAITNRGSWPGNGVIGLIGHRISSSGTLQLDASTSSSTLTVEWQEPVQFLDPVTIHMPVTVGAVEFTQSIAPATIHVPVTVGAVDIVAPRILRPATIHVPVTVGVPEVSGTGDAPPLNMAGTIHIPVRVGVALLSLTIPPAAPPIPWQRLIDSPEYRDALDSRQPVTDARVEVISPAGAIIAALGGTDATHPGVVSGSVSCNGDSPIRWTCDLTINNPDLVPGSHHDLLHPLAHNRVRIWWRILLADGTWGEVPVGTYFLDWPQITDSGDASLAMSARGSDPVAEVRRAKYRDPIDVSGMSASDAVRAILEDRAPWATLSISPSGYRLPEEYEAGEPGGDPVDDIMGIADAAGMVFYADRMGTLTLTAAPNMSNPVESFQEGPGCAMTEVSATVDLDELLNSVTVVSTISQDADGNDVDPIVADATDDDPTSPLYIGREGGHIYHDRIESDSITTQAQADDLARKVLDEARALVDRVELIAFARPHLDPGDVVEISADRARITGARQVQQWSLALGDLSGQRITAAGRRGLS